MPTSRHHHSRGFTLIELMIVVTFSAMILITVTQLFIVSLSSRAKTNIRKDIKAEGTYALNQMEFLIRNAQPPSETQNPIDCSGVPGTITFMSKDGGTTTLRLESASSINRIASKSAAAATGALLTSDAVVASNLVFDCDEAVDGGQYITVSFRLTKQGDIGTTAISEDFKSGIQIRNSTGRQ